MMAKESSDTQPRSNDIDIQVPTKLFNGGVHDHRTGSDPGTTHEPGERTGAGQDAIPFCFVGHIKNDAICWRMYVGGDRIPSVVGQYGACRFADARPAPGHQHASICGHSLWLSEVGPDKHNGLLHDHAVVDDIRVDATRSRTRSPLNRPADNQDAVGLRDRIFEGNGAPT